jgi:hypothetical protein
MRIGPEDQENAGKIRFKENWNLQVIGVYESREA